MSTLEDLMELQRRKNLLTERDTKFRISQLEKDFLHFSSQIQENALRVRLPKLYAIEGEKKSQLAAAIETMMPKNGGNGGNSTNNGGDDVSQEAGKAGNVVKVPKAVDISGWFSHFTSPDTMLILSPQQLEVDCMGVRTYVLPLVEKIYSEGNTLIRDFTVHELLAGKVLYRRGELDLREISLFPEKFMPGPLEMSLTLDTPDKTIATFRDFSRRLGEIKENPKECLLSPQKVNEVTKEGALLRMRLGSLSRYDVPEQNTFAVIAPSCVVQFGKGTEDSVENSKLFYIYVPAGNKNVMIYFGKKPFSDAVAEKIKGLEIINGKERHYALPKLIELGVFSLSRQVLEQRISDMEKAKEQATRAAGVSLDAQMFESFLEGLQQARSYFRNVTNLQMHLKYALEQPPELLEFMIYPTTDDPVVHELLPRLSWNKAVRRYHKTQQFIENFGHADEAARAKLLKEVATNVLFNHQQNNDVNVWLYQNHRGFCEQSGVKFKVEE